MKNYSGTVSAAIIQSVGINGIPIKYQQTLALLVVSCDDPQVRFNITDL